MWMIENCYPGTNWEQSIWMTFLETSRKGNFAEGLIDSCQMCQARGKNDVTLFAAVHSGCCWQGKLWRPSSRLNRSKHFENLWFYLPAMDIIPQIRIFILCTVWRVSRKSRHVAAWPAFQATAQRTWSTKQECQDWNVKIKFTKWQISAVVVGMCCMNVVK